MAESKVLRGATALAVALLGAWLVLRSPALGTQAAGAVLAAQRSGMPTEQFLVLLTGEIDAFRWLGIVLAALGVHRLLGYIA
jgi:hypothetical protein